MKALTLRDEKLLSLAANGMSGEEIAAEIGISPEAAVLRVREIISSRDVWDDVEREKLLLQDLYNLKSRLEKNLDAIVSDPKMLEGYRRTLDLLGVTLERRSKVNDSDLEKVTQAQARKMLQLIEAGYGRARQLLSAEYADVDTTVIDAAFLSGMNAERVKIESEEV